MDIDVTLKNYRCFSDESPATIHLRPAFTGFIGTNNAGKSSLLKSFFEFRQLFEAARETAHLGPALMGRAQTFNHQPTTFDQSEIFHNSNPRDLVLEVSLPDATAFQLPTVRNLTLRILRDTNTWTATTDFDDVRLREGSMGVNDNGIYLANQLFADLRPMREALKDLIDTLYIGPFRNAVNIGSNDKYFDIETGQAFIGKWKHLKSGTYKSQNEASHKLTEEMRDIFGFRSLEISPSADDRTIQFLVDGRSFKLNEVGGGLAQFLIVLANAATRNPSYILIDEPELNLHPSLQAKFLTTLGSYAKKGVLFATHSIGLARGASDYVYSVRKVGNRNSTVHDLQATPSFAEFLGELGFSSYRELGYGKIFLVEGRTEIKTMQEFLRKWKKDHEFVVMSLAGSDMINPNIEQELSEVLRLSDKIVALIDSELPSRGQALEPARQGFVKVCEKLSIRCHVLDRRAIENYLPDRAVKIVTEGRCRALSEFERFADVSPRWSKSENWRIAKEMTLEEIQTTDLGTFLASI